MCHIVYWASLLITTTRGEGRLGCDWVAGIMLGPDVENLEQPEECGHCSLVILLYSNLNHEDVTQKQIHVAEAAMVESVCLTM